MGMDHIVACYVGFRLDIKQIYHNETVCAVPENCEHTYENKMKDKHCRECGAEVHTKKVKSFVQRVNKNIEDALSQQDRDYRGESELADDVLFPGSGYVLGKIGTETIELFSVKFEEPNFVVGVHVQSVDPHYGEVLSGDMPKVTAQQLIAFLATRGITVSSKDFGIHLLTHIS